MQPWVTCSKVIYLPDSLVKISVCYQSKVVRFQKATKTVSWIIEYLLLLLCLSIFILVSVELLSVSMKRDITIIYLSPYVCEYLRNSMILEKCSRWVSGKESTLLWLQDFSFIICFMSHVNVVKWSACLRSIWEFMRCASTLSWGL